jgi:hypothetical protein
MLCPRLRVALSKGHMGVAGSARTCASDIVQSFGRDVSPFLMMIVAVCSAGSRNAEQG